MSEATKAMMIVRMRQVSLGRLKSALKRIPSSKRRSGARGALGTGAPVTRNVGGLDRKVRWIAAAVLLAIAFFVDMAGVWRMLAFVIGAAAMFTALFSYCPINAAMGVNTLTLKN